MFTIPVFNETSVVIPEISILKPLLLTNGNVFQFSPSVLPEKFYGWRAVAHLAPPPGLQKYAYRGR